MPASAVNYDGARFCQVDDALGIGEMFRWPMMDVTWCITGSLPGITDAEFKAAAQDAWGYWMAVCGVRLHYESNPQRANILMGLQSQGPGNVLADSELPTPGTTQNTQLRQRYDVQEAWVIAENPPPNKIDLVRVIAHEGCHALGVPHIGTGNLMAPVYSTKIRKPQPGDVAEMVARYGLPPTSPTPPAAPPSDPAVKELVFIGQRQEQYVIRLMGKQVYP